MTPPPHRFNLREANRQDCDTIEVRGPGIEDACENWVNSFALGRIEPEDRRCYEYELVALQEGKMRGENRCFITQARSAGTIEILRGLFGTRPQ